MFEKNYAALCAAIALESLGNPPVDHQRDDTRKKKKKKKKKDPHTRDPLTFSGFK